MKVFRNKNFWFKLSLALVILVYLRVAINKLLNFDYDQWLGYLDHQTYWQGLYSFAQGGVNFRDFIYEYGIFYLLVGLPFFLVLGKTFFASTLLMYVILPIITLILSYLIGKQLLSTGPLALFLLLLLFYEVNSFYPAARHIVPEFGLIMLLVGLEKENRFKTILGSFFLAFSFTLTLEYGIIALVAASVYFLIQFIKKPAPQVLSKVLLALLPFASFFIPYFTFLAKTGALKNLLNFTLSNISFWYTNSPCRDLFPRFDEISLDPINFFRRLNLYIIPLVLIGFLIWVIKKRKTSWFPIMLPLVIYSFLAYYRTLNTPCLGYMSYSLTFFFLILAFILQQKTSPPLKAFFGLTTIWFLLTAWAVPLPDFFRNLTLPKVPKSSEEKVYLPVAGVRLKKELALEYQAIAKFIQENTQADEDIYVYPLGPYYQLTGKNSPVTIMSPWHYEIAPFLVDLTVQQLTEKSPKFVVINTYNAWSIKSSLNNVSYNIHSQGKDVIFEGILTPVEDFIAQNYEIAKKFDIAWVLTRRDKPAPLQKLYLPVEEKVEWQIAGQKLQQKSELNLENKVSFVVTGNNPQLTLNPEKEIAIRLIRLPIKVDLGASKMFSKLIIEIYGVYEDEKVSLLNRQIAASNWQDIWFYPSQSDKPDKIKSIIVSISNNKGFFWWGKSKTIEIKPLDLFVQNKELKIEDSAF